MIRAAFLALLSHWRKQPVQLVTLVLGLALATGLWSAVQAINAEARASYARAAAQLGTNQTATLTAPSGMIDVDTYVRLRRSGWQVSPVLEGRTRLADTGVTIIGVDVLTYPTFPWPKAETTAIDPSDVLSGSGRLFADPATAAGIANIASLPPVIISPNVPPGLVITDIATAARLLGRPEQISRLIILEHQPLGRPPLDQIAPDLIVRAPEARADAARLTDSFHLNLTAFGFLSFAVGLFIVHGTIGLAFQQRRGMFRTLRALGLPAWHLGGVLVVELVVFALIAGSLGLIIGYLIAAALLPDVAASLRGLYGAPMTGVLTLRPLWFASGLGMAVVGALLAGGHGLVQLTRLPILASPGAQSWLANTSRQLGKMAGTGVVLFVSGLISLFIFPGLYGGFALLAGIMLGAALLLPPLLGVVLSWAATRATGPVSQWIFADLRTQLPGLSLALMALLLALATNIGVGTMVSSFRMTFTAWLDQRLAADLYITARTDTQGHEIFAWLTAQNIVALPIRWTETQINGHPTRLYGVIDDSTYRDNWPVLSAVPNAWNRIAQGDAVLINEQLARRENLTLGAKISLGQDWPVEIVGIYSDYGNPTGQAITNLAELVNRFPLIPNRQFGVLTGAQNAPDLTRDMLAAFDLPATGIVNQAAIKKASLGIFEKTFVVTSALNILTLGVASFAILTSLLTLWTMRIPQLAPVWALGLSRRQLGLYEVARSATLAGITAVLALPLGLALAWVLLAIINVQAFGWRLPMHLFPGDWSRLGALAIAAGGVAAAVPARRLQKLPPSDLLKVFSSER